MNEPKHFKNKKRTRGASIAITGYQTGRRMKLPQKTTYLNSVAFRQFKLLEAGIYPFFYAKFR